MRLDLHVNTLRALSHTTMVVCGPLRLLLVSSLMTLTVRASFWYPEQEERNAQRVKKSGIRI